MSQPTLNFTCDMRSSASCSYLVFLSHILCSTCLCRAVVDVAYVPFLTHLLDPQQFKPPVKDDLRPPKHWQMMLLKYMFDWLQAPPLVCYCRSQGCRSPAAWYPPSSFDAKSKKLGAQPPRPPVLALCNQHRSQR